MATVDLTKLLAKEWPYSTADPAALAEIGARVARVGKRRELIHYSRLTSGLELRIPSVGGGVPFELGVPDWTDLDRNILGDLLGRLSLDSYQRGSFIASALVTAKGTQEPGQGFWNFVAEMGAFSSTSPTRRLMFWTEQVRIAHDWYATNAW
ncbi:MAG TPA: hypothetical protein VFX92_04750 [Candidatus Krumholzibacteria bacterium]|nr:hypothetical protein [Candidatus Krumholzibacteria bacterium]